MVTISCVDVLTNFNNSLVSDILYFKEVNMRKIDADKVAWVSKYILKLCKVIDRSNYEPLEREYNKYVYCIHL